MTKKRVDFMERVLIVEDDENIRQLLKLTLASFNYELVDFENGKDAYDYLQNNKVDLAILDLMLPGMNGYDILKFIRSKTTLKDLPVIILSAKDKELDKIMGLDLGADDYLTKPFSVLELAARIRSLLRRSKKDERLIQIHGLCIDLDKRTVTIHEEPVELTFKEFELLKYLAKNEGRAVSREELINQIWGYDFIGESRTLDVHINSLRKKMGNEYAHWIQSVRQVGYRFVAEDNNA
jgi:two-component system alkaline phosphatase synthesis response regulator PhoP